MAMTLASIERAPRAWFVTGVQSRTFEIGVLAVRALMLELSTWPKPGLVSRVDSGSHVDMDAETFHRSADAIAPHFRIMADAGARDCGMESLRAIGLAAEADMLMATGGVNTHRGAIFGLGLLCAAAGVAASGPIDTADSLGSIVSRAWGSAIASGPLPPHSHGTQGRRRYGAGGARREAEQGFPSVYNVGLPALRQGAVIAPNDPEAARVHACFALIAAVQDTNLLHRGGLDGLRYARESAQRFLDDGSVGQADWRGRASAVHEAFVARRLSPGGSADLLAMSLFVQAYETSYS
jgi:triphosphoribosyl-dephospho-CoA synthase